MQTVIQILAVTGIYLLASCNSKPAAGTSDTTKYAAVKTDSITTHSNDASRNRIIKWSNIEIRVPQGWESKQDTMNGRPMFFLLAPKEMNYQTNINILKDPMKNESLDDYIKVSLAKMRSMQITMGPEGNFSANGNEGKYLKYLATANNVMIAVKSYVFPKNDTAYIVTATTLPQLGKKFEPVFDKAVGTLKIN